MEDPKHPEVRGDRQRLRRALLAVIALLYLLSVPWYWGSTGRLEIWFGLPSWVAVALGCYAAVAVLNAVAWLLTEIPEAAEAPDAPDAERADAPEGESD